MRPPRSASFEKIENRQAPAAFRYRNIHDSILRLIPSAEDLCNRSEMDAAQFRIRKQRSDCHSLPLGA
jgi:hypothetical protein